MPSGRVTCRIAGVHTQRGGSQETVGDHAHLVHRLAATKPVSTACSWASRARFWASSEPDSWLPGSDSGLPSPIPGFPSPILVLQARFLASRARFLVSRARFHHILGFPGPIPPYSGLPRSDSGLPAGWSRARVEPPAGGPGIGRQPAGF